MSRLRVTVEDRWGELRELTYEIYGHDLAQRWLAVTLRQLGDLHALDAVLHNRTQQDLDQCRREITETLRTIRALKPDSLSAVEEPLVLDQTQLNHLHRQFERFQDWEDPELHRLFHLMNTQIHLIESASAIKSSGPGSFNLLYDINPGREYQLLEPEDRQWAEPDLQWGGLYLGYSTVGKDWLAVYQNDDRDLIACDSVTPQQRFSAETWLCFNSGQTRSQRILGFQQWYRSLPAELKHRVPIDNLSELSLGKFRIGQLIIDQQFLDLDPDPWHWQAQGHPCRDLWNHVVFRSFRHLREIKILP